MFFIAYNIHFSINDTLNLSKLSFRDYITDNIELIFDLNDDQQTRELVEKHEERVSKQVDKLQNDIGTADDAIKFYQENNDLEIVEREKHRHNRLIEEIQLVQRRHETFVELAQKKTINAKKNNNKKKNYSVH